MGGAVIINVAASAQVVISRESYLMTCPAAVEGGTTSVELPTLLSRRSGGGMKKTRGFDGFRLRRHHGRAIRFRK